MGSLGGIPETILAVLLLLILGLVVVSTIVAGPAYVFAAGAATLSGWAVPDFGTVLLVVMAAIFAFFVFANS